MFGSKRKLNIKLDSGKATNEKIAQWGVKKFDPSTKPAGTNPFRQLHQIQNKFKGRDRYNRSNNNGRNVRNNRPTLRPENAKPENATPWAKFKDDINHKQRDEEQASKQANFDTEEGKKFVKQREITHRKMLMEEKRNETTTWEDFGDEDCGNTRNKPGKAESTKKPEKGIHKKKNGKGEKVVPPPPLVDDETLKNFDASKLSIHQKNKIRQMLTKATALRHGGVEDTLKHVRQQKKKNKKNKL